MAIPFNLNYYVNNNPNDSLLSAYKSGRSPESALFQVNKSKL